MEMVVEFWGVGTKKDFLLTYDKFIVIMAIFLFPSHSQEDIANRFNSYEIGLEQP